MSNFMKVSKRKVVDVHKKENTMKSVKFVLIILQLFGFMPLNGVSSSDPNSLKFTWMSFKSFYTLVNLFCSIFILIMSTIDGIKMERPFTEQFFDKIFNTNYLLSIIYFIYLAKRWQKLMVEWVNVDKLMDKNYGYPKTLDIHLKLVAVFFLLLSLVEHLLSIVAHIERLKRKFPLLDLQIFYTNVYTNIFRHYNYSVGFVLLAQFIITTSTFIWNYSSLFVTIFSTILAVRFKQIAKRLENEEQNKKLQLNEDYWIDLRNDYNRLYLLCKSLDELLSPIIFWNYAINVIFITKQIFFSLKTIKGVVAYIYFIFSFAFLMLRTIGTCIYASWLNEASKEPLIFLHSVSSSSYNVEIYRLIRQIKFDDASLSGLNMFRVTRQMLLTIAGVIVTYELILLQFIGHPE